MCYFVTVGVPEDRAACLEAAIPRGLAATPAANPSITRHLPKRYRTYIITTGMCSCDLFFPSSPAPRDEGAHADKLRRKYEKQGWTKAKIERAIAQSQSSSRSPPEPPPAGLGPDLCEILAAVAEEAGELAIVAHWYDEDLEAGRFTVHEGETVTPDSLRAGQPAIGKDQVFFVKSSNRTRR
ncbi:hypothetical protein AYO40_03375 [Planctomycetaceae bacterium SCGC AG-212-D15]|nr:hypothetical protein AYO40_03375 [Planctomycetaceae bacterium SCGC AG-212-D15]